MISIVIPLYNKETCINRTLQSVFAQTFQDYEIIIVNDGSTDNSVKEVEKCTDARIRLIHQPNAGVSAARNRGIEEAKFELIAFLDADDEWKPEYLQTQYELYRKYPECSVYACNYEYCENDIKIILPHINNLPFCETDGILTNYFEVASYSNPPLWTSAVMVNKTAILKIGGFLLNATLGEDLLTWAKLACQYKIAYSSTSLAIYNFPLSARFVSPRRPPDSPDLVGKEFRILLSHYQQTPFLNIYIALWHKMRMVTYVKQNMKKEAINEFKIIRSYIHPNLKMRFWLFFNHLPHPVCRLLLRLLARIKR